MGPTNDLKRTRNLWSDGANQPPARWRVGAFRREKGAMRSFAKVFAAAAAAIGLAGSASAASLIQLKASSMVAPGVFQIDVFLDGIDDPALNPAGSDPIADPAMDLTAFQMDIEVNTNGQASLAPDPAFATANTVRNGPPGGVVPSFPFDLSDDINDPTGPIDVRMVYAANNPFTLASMAATTANSPNCLLGNCGLQDAGLSAGLLYLGSFNLAVPNGQLDPLNYGGPTVALRINAATVFGETDTQPQNGTDAFIGAIRASLSGLDSSPILIERGVRVEGLVPEPTGLALFGLALAAFGFVRRNNG